ncbi:MAG: hypothetical protein EPO26_16650 [Chloroflexota bacterium]|nr:MAG: hypothetical protein EPO26_16650 [Chloroflexota bacterium]
MASPTRVPAGRSSGGGLILPLIALVAFVGLAAVALYVMFGGNELPSAGLSLTPGPGVGLAPAGRSTSSLTSAVLPTPVAPGGRAPEPAFPSVNLAATRDGSAERAVAEFLSGWQATDFGRMAAAAAPSWRTGRGDPTRAIAQQFTGRQLLGADMGPIESARQDIAEVPVTIWTTGPDGRIEERRLVAVAVPETPDGQLAPGEGRGRVWGLNPDTFAQRLADTTPRIVTPVAALKPVERPAVAAIAPPPALSTTQPTSHPATPVTEPPRATAAAPTAPRILVLAPPAAQSVLAGPRPSPSPTPMRLGAIETAAAQPSPIDAASVAAMRAAQAAAAAPTGTPEPDFPSGGLGLTRNQWQRAQAQSAPGADGARGWYVVDERDGNISRIERNWPDGSGPPIEDARRIARGLMPDDARIARGYQTAAGRSVEIFQSAALWTRFEAAGAWEGGEPGEFAVVYSSRGGRVASLVIATGTGP